jgi:hypothetical protein
MIRRYIAPLFLVLGPIAMLEEGILVGLCLLGIGIGGTINLFSERTWAQAQAVQRFGLISFALSGILLVVIVMQRSL